MNGICSIQNVIEADGSIFPCNFYVFEEYKLGNINEIEDFNEILKSQKVRFLYLFSNNRESGRLKEKQECV
jgi:uncharacterized protein